MTTRILHVTQATGGLETILLMIFKHYDRERFEFHLACPPHSALETGAQELGIQVHPIAMVRRIAPIRDSLALRQLVTLIRRERFSIVHGHSAKGGYLARMAARLSGAHKTVYAPQAFSFLSQRGFARGLFRLLERAAVPMTDLLIASSASERTLALRSVGYAPERVTVIPNSIDFAEAAELGSTPKDGPPVVLTTGRLSYQKNPEMFVRVAAAVARRKADVKFVMLGAGFAGPLEVRVRRLVAELGLGTKLSILPWSPKNEALRAVARAKVFVLTSRFEGMPNTLLESLMLGTPAVVTDVDGSRDVIENGVGGYTVPFNNVEAMAERIIELLDDPETAKQVCERGQERARQDFDIRKNIIALGLAYQTLLN